MLSGACRHADAQRNAALLIANFVDLKPCRRRPRTRAASRRPPCVVWPAELEQTMPPSTTSAARYPRDPGTTAAGCGRVERVRIHPDLTGANAPSRRGPLGGATSRAPRRLGGHPHGLAGPAISRCCAGPSVPRACQAMWSRDRTAARLARGLPLQSYADVRAAGLDSECRSRPCSAPLAIAPRRREGWLAYV